MVAELSNLKEDPRPLENLQTCVPKVLCVTRVRVYAWRDLNNTVVIIVKTTALEKKIDMGQKASQDFRDRVRAISRSAKAALAPKETIALNP